MSNKHYDYIEKTKINWINRELFGIKEHNYIFATTVFEKQIESIIKRKRFFYLVTKDKVILLFKDKTDLEMNSWLIDNKYIPTQL